MTLICLWTGTKYPFEYVEKLWRGVDRFTTIPFKKRVITKADFPGWWQKLLIFPPNDRTVFLDLDVVITGNVDFLFEYEGQFCMWGDPWNGKYNSSVMSIAPGFGLEIRDEFLNDPKLVMNNFHGDQEFISSIIHKIDTWQEIALGRIKSYKADNLLDGPQGASIVVFHGEPKPHELGGWVRDYWI